MQIMLALTTAVALAGGGVLALDAVERSAPLMPASYYTEQAQLPAKRIVIGIDLSKSNPLIDDADFAAKVAARVADAVRNLGFASEVHVRTFGSYDASSNNFHYDVLISVRNRPETVAAEVQKLIAGTPLLVQRGRWRSQGRTNILAFMDNVSESLGCGRLPTSVILASDGVEDSEYAHLEDLDGHLPRPDGHPFAGCAEMQILGLGVGTGSPRHTVHLREEWNRWALAAGFHRFAGLNDW
jgi:hypothetical protein